jgi:hypothetical protein
MVIAGATAAHAGVPLTVEDSAEGDEFLTDYGDFDLRDHFTFEIHGKVFLDDAGNPVRIVEQVSGTDTFYNSVTGESVRGTINAGETVDLVDGTVTENGTIGRITVPGLGVVFFDVGKVHHRLRRRPGLPGRPSPCLLRGGLRATLRVAELTINLRLYDWLKWS